MCCLHGELCQSDYVLEERTQDKLSNNKVQFITLFSGSAPCNYYTNTRAHRNLSIVGTLKKEKGPSVSWKWRSEGPHTSKTSGNSEFKAEHEHCEVMIQQVQLH